jgi:hypothetical protein
MELDGMEYMQNKKGWVTIYNNKLYSGECGKFYMNITKFFNGFRSGNRQIYLIDIELSFEVVESAFGNFEKSKTE